MNLTYLTILMKESTESGEVMFAMVMFGIFAKIKGTVFLYLICK